MSEERGFPIRPPGPWRPPTGTWPPPGPGAWPPPPPPFPRPPDFFSWFFWLNQNYEDATQAREFFKRVLSDLLVDDPGLLASRQAIVGVTDGSDAQPGMVGEVQRFVVNAAVPSGGVSGLSVTAGILPPGDWDGAVWANGPEGATYIQYVLDPVPAGVSGGELSGAMSNPTGNNVLVVGCPTRLLVAVPTLLAFRVSVNGPNVGTFNMEILARRRR